MKGKGSIHPSRALNFFMEKIICQKCGRRFERKSIQGKKPLRCSSCREKIKDEWRLNNGGSDRISRR